ncbi:MAG: hypothetical protein Ta2G_10020 [Termitinemataceae bacterium]|nr:MAG: hypothetical protein Ta2G_10020 [Termitinemataceae bacterium]
MKKSIAFVFVLAAVLCGMAGAFAQSDASKEIIGSGEDGTVLHKDIIYQNAKPGDYLTRKSGEDRGKVIILKQEDIDYSESEIGRINEELLDTAPGSIRALLDEIIAGENIEFSDEATEVEEIPYSELSGRVVEYISDIRNGQQIILIVANKKHASFFDTRFSVPPWYKAKKEIPPDLIEFILAKKVTSTENRIFSFNEDIEVTKTMIREVQEAEEVQEAPKPIPQREKDFKVSTVGGKVTITGYKGSAADVVIPATIKGKQVTSIGDWAFRDCTSITSVSIPASVTSIGDWAFLRCTSLTSVSIPAGVTSIGSYAFEGCTGLTAIQLDTNNKKYTSRDGVFFNKIGDTLIRYPAGKKEKQYVIPESVTIIEVDAFSSCTGLTSVSIPASVTSIEGGAFCGCTGLTSVSIPASVTSIGRNAFDGCTGLTSVSIPASVTSIGRNAFFGCTGLTSISIPASVTSIGRNAFSDCIGLTSVTIPASVTNIEFFAFSGCIGLTSVSIPASVTSISSYAFSKCTGLTSISIGANVKLTGGDSPSFDNKFDDYYNTNGKKAGVYTWRGGAWSYAER